MKMVNLSENFQNQDELEGGANRYFQNANEVPDTILTSWRLIPPLARRQLFLRRRSWGPVNLQRSKGRLAILTPNPYILPCTALPVTAFSWHSTPQSSNLLILFSNLMNLSLNYTADWSVIGATPCMHPLNAYSRLKNRDLICLSNFKCRKVC